LKTSNIINLLVDSVVSKLLYKRTATTFISQFYKCEKHKFNKKINLLLSNNHIYIYQNMVSSLVGFKKYLRLRGVGYKFSMVIPHVLDTEVGFSKMIRSQIPAEFLTKYSNKGTRIRLISSRLLALSQFAAKLRKYRFPDVYKGKGIRYRRDFARLKKVKKKKTF
jgi:large subunit ribosomal protein L6